MRVRKPAGALAVLAAFLSIGTQPVASTPDLPPDYQVLAPVTSVAPLDVDRLERRVDGAWSDPSLGSDKGLALDTVFSSPEPEVARSARSVFMPASTTKLLTAAAALRTFGPEHRFRTTVTRSGNQVFLIGGGDPQLTTSRTSGAINADASLVRLARRTVVALQEAGVSAVRLRYDASLFGAPAEAPFWKADFLAIGVVAPITALSADGGRLNPPASPRSPNPPLTAAQEFARLLQARDVQVLGEPTPRTAAGDEIAAVESAPLADLVEHLLLTSDNTEADILAHQVGLEVLGDPTFAGGARATLQVLADLGIDTSGIVLNDGSGLSRSNRISPESLIDVLRAAVETDPQQLWPVYTGLPVAGFDGSLASRFSAASARPARGAVTGKTGTLTGTSTLAGFVSDRDGQLLMYAVMTNEINNFAASPAIDDVLARVAGCRCAEAPEG
ncbi:MAG: D-alanyl-D-alanine carboxypeptidase/D-alanyl-D-alanine-endopeptidase [Candidatus Nanopelagicales bacterium]